MPTGRNALLHAKGNVLEKWSTIHPVMTGVLWLPAGLIMIIYAMHVRTYSFQLIYDWGNISVLNEWPISVLVQLLQLGSHAATMQTCLGFTLQLA